MAYAIAYVEGKIESNEKFSEKYEGDKESLAQFGLVEKYKQELKELNYLFEDEYKR
ncbi:hypothetical protein [Lysinibacillus sp. UGB7]|uniref:hypothetical protein n=1 Tax=Lysinibacillus sp. UGB7 TaxID=3411039 RepID=UPI003B9F2650